MKRLRTKLKIWRERPVVSRVLSRVVNPLYRCAVWITRRVPWMIRVNGGRVNFDGIELTFPVNVGITYCTLGWWQGAGGYEPATWKVIQSYVQQSDVFWDVGSNIGLYSVLAKKIKPGIRVEAFEPVPSLFAANQKFQLANNSGVEPRQVAISSHGDGAEITVRKYADVTEVEPTASLEKEVNLSVGADSEILKVKTQTLDSMIDSLAPEDKLFIKVDVEGHENHVLKGAQILLKARRPILLCEILPGTAQTKEIAAIMAEARYAFLAVCREGLFLVSAADLDKPRGYTDYVLIPEEKLQIPGHFFGFNELPD